MEKFVNKLKGDYPQITFIASDVASWSAAANRISYKAKGGIEAQWALLHELSHSLLGHSSYSGDVELLLKEVAAWERACELAFAYKLKIEGYYIQDCLDTYRDWVHRRSSCPICDVQGVQQSERLYQCLNCQTAWRVSSHRFCRPYRLKRAQTAK